MKKHLLFLLSYFILFQIAFCQYDQKYWNYRERFRKYFTVIGSGQGESNVLVVRNGREHGNISAGATEIRVGNQVMNLGDYIAMLAMEYKILSAAGQSVNQTAKELYYALYAFNRLDYVAETHFGMTAELNGFFIRDDVYSGIDFVASHPDLNIGLSAPPCSTCYVDYIPGSGEVQWVDHTVGKVTSSSFQFPSKCTESSNPDNDFDDQEDFRTTDLPSPDEIVGLFFGMAMVVKCVPSTANYNNMAMNDADGNIYFVDAAKNITDRVAIWLKDHSWDIESPTGCTLWGGLTGSPDPIKYAYATAAGEIMGDPNKYRNVWMTGIDWCAIDPYVDWFNVGKISINVKIVCMLAVVGDSWNCLNNPWESTYEKVFESTEAYNNWKYFYPLIYTVLHGGSNSISQTEVENLLASAPENGPFNHNTANNPNDFGSNGWCTSFLFRHDNDEQQGVNAEGKAYGAPGNYHGLDYMLLYNLYRILYFPIPVCAAKPDLLLMPDFYPANYLPNTTIAAKNTIITSGNAVPMPGQTWRAGNSIELNDGFETLDGQTWTAEIGDCIELFDRLSNPDTTHTFTKTDSVLQVTASREPLPKSLPEADNPQFEKTKSEPDSSQSEIISITPNPSTDGKFNINCNLNNVGCMEAEISVFDVSGKRIYTEQKKHYYFPASIDISTLPKGTYFIKIQNENKIFVNIVVSQ